jgi:hypothetical protein
MFVAPWLIIPSGIAIAVLVLAFNVFGDMLWEFLAQGFTDDDGRPCGLTLGVLSESEFGKD